MAVDQVQQREQEDPDDVDEVPVQAGDLDRRVVLGGELALAAPDRSDQVRMPTPIIMCSACRPVMAK